MSDGTCINCGEDGNWCRCEDTDERFRKLGEDMARRHEQRVLEQVFGKDAIQESYGFTNYTGGNTQDQPSLEQMYGIMQRAQREIRKSRAEAGVDCYLFTREQWDRIAAVVDVEERNGPAICTPHSRSNLLGIPVYVAEDLDEFNRIAADLIFKQGKWVGVLDEKGASDEPS